MKTSVQVFKPPEGEKGPRIPISFQLLQPVIIQGMAWVMRMFGLSKITVRPAMVTLLTVPDITFKPLIENPPPEFMASRTFVARSIALFMLLFGIMDVEIFPDEKELRSLRQEWSELVRGVNRAALNKDTIKLNLEADPTGESVLDEPAYTPAVDGTPATTVTVQTPESAEQPST